MQILRSPSARKRLAILLVILVPAIFAACAPGSSQSTFDSAGPVAEDQKNIFIFIFWIAVVVFIIVEGALFYSIFRFRRARHDSDLPAQVHGNNRLEIAWTMAPVVILVAIALPTVFLIFDQDRGPINGHRPENPLRVNAVGHQWWFEFEYPDENVVTANELHIPVNTAVELSLASDDVIHSFWVPRLAGKLDMVPHQDNTLFLQADEVGTFRGQCAEFCGEAHANMRFRVVAQTQEDYQKWLTDMRTPPAPLVAGSPEEAGSALFASNCSTCHTTRSYDPAISAAEDETQRGRQAAFLANPTDSGIIAAPNLTHLALRERFAAGIIDLNRENLERWIRNPDDVKDGTRMKKLAAVYNDPARKLSDKEVSQIAAYLLSLKPGEGAAPVAVEESGPVDGAQVFQGAGCSACHSTGSDRIVGPGFAGLKDRAASTVDGLSAEEYVRQSVTEPSAFVVDGFPDGVMPKSFGSQLSDAELDALVAYLLTLE